VDSSQTRTRTPVILVVDDEEGVRAVTRRMLEAGGYRVVTAAHGAQALKVLAADGPVDAVVTDLRMPVMGGRELADHLVREWPDLPVLFMSGFDVYVGEVRLPGPVLAKPFDCDALTAALSQVLRWRRPESARSPVGERRSPGGRSHPSPR
jgi:two-component system cell cycle sensor histidine kinase/response regulator CckA